MKNCYFIDLHNQDKNKKIFALVEQIYRDQKKAIIYTSSIERAEEIDRILWILKQESFIPHKIFKYEESDALEPIGIVTQEINPINAQIIILDSPCKIEFAKKFSTIYDFVDKSSEEALKISRERYIKFKELKYNMFYQK
jgi:DNA polymerase-3 subunit chi